MSNTCAVSESESVMRMTKEDYEKLIENNEALLETCEGFIYYNSRKMAEIGTGLKDAFDKKLELEEQIEKFEAEIARLGREVE